MLFQTNKRLISKLFEDRHSINVLTCPIYFSVDCKTRALKPCDQLLNTDRITYIKKTTKTMIVHKKI